MVLRLCSYVCYLECIVIRVGTFIFSIPLLRFSWSLFVLPIVIPIAPGPPSNLRLVPIDSTSLRFSWELPAQQNGIVTGYNYSCTQTESVEELARNTTNSNITSVVLTGLSPFTNYTCSVSASTSAGTGAAAIQTGITNMTGIITTFTALPSLYLSF